MKLSTDKIWQKIHSQRDWGKYPNEELVRFIGKKFKKLKRTERKKIKILELGVGQGANVWFLIREGFDVYGIDISSSAIKKTERRLKKEKLLIKNFSFHFKEADIRKLPFKKENFDMIIDIATVWYVSYLDHPRVYKEIYRVLKPKALFFSWHVLEKSWGDKKGKLIDKDTIDNVTEGPLSNTGITYFAKYRDLIKLLEKTGFEIVEKEKLIRTYENMKKAINYAIITCRRIK